MAHNYPRYHDSLRGLIGKLNAVVDGSQALEAVEQFARSGFSNQPLAP